MTESRVFYIQALGWLRNEGEQGTQASMIRPLWQLCSQAERDCLVWVETSRSVRRGLHIHDERIIAGLGC